MNSSSDRFFCDGLDYKVRLLNTYNYVEKHLELDVHK